MIPVLPSRAGYEADAVAVAAELANVPQPYAQALGALGIRVVACRDSVVDHLPQLENVGVRGWPPGASWRTIPGVYSPKDRTVVVATVGEGAAPRRVPATGEQHGSISLAVHETFHGFDYSTGHLRSKAKRFRNAWKADRALLGHEYYTNKKAGHEESYAESAARAFGLDARFRGAWPSLAAFWAVPQSDPLDGLSGDAEPGTDGPEAAPVIGMGRFRRDGALVLDLRAEGPDGLVGHGLLVIEPGDSRYAPVAEHLGIPADLEMDAIDVDASFAVPRFGD